METAAITLCVAPNPNNGIFKIGYNIPKENTKYTILVYNVLGQVVVEINGNNSRGYHENDVHSNLTTGVYFAKISINQHIYTTKFLIVK